MLVRVHGATNAAIDINAEVQWRAPVAGRFGSCSMDIQRDSAAWDLDIIWEHGRFMLEAITDVGSWFGVTDGEPDYSAAGVTVNAEHISAWPRIRLTGQPRIFRYAPAGLIARYAFRDALIAHDGIPLTIGSMVICPPLVPSMIFDGQPLSQVLRELVSLTGQEWWIDDQFRINWGMQQGRHHEIIITDDERLHPNIRIEGGVIAESIEVTPAGQVTTYRSGEADPIWPEQTLDRL